MIVGLRDVADVGQSVDRDVATDVVADERHGR
jgi:hypothetical protein